MLPVSERIPQGQERRGGEEWQQLMQPASLAP